MTHEALASSPIEDLDRALDQAVTTVRQNLDRWGELFPNDCTVEGTYPLRPAQGSVGLGGNRGWTTSFWPGMLWIAFEATADPVLRDAALGHLADFERRLDEMVDLDHHDIGFLYTLAAVAPSQILNDDRARALGVRAAHHLMTRFLPAAGIIQAWGDLDDPHQRGRTIIDSLLNLPLLSWAFRSTKDDAYDRAVRRHAAALRDNIVRPDGSTFHTFHWDPVTGVPSHGSTAQGASDDSSWARGQAWGIYGFALNSRATGDRSLLDTAWRCADYFLAHQPEDGVTYWDLACAHGSDAPRDSSASAIAACGLLEISELESDPVRASSARAAAIRIMSALIQGYTPDARDSANCLLLHGVYSFPNGSGVDEGNLWGDYFYLEALMRLNRPTWRPYW